MATFYVKKDGSGSHTQIQSAIYDASNGDIIIIEAGTFYENIEFMGKSLTLQGAGKDQTIIEGKAANDTFICTWFAGEDVITTSSTSALVRGKPLSNSFLTAGSRVSQILSETQFKPSLATSTSGNYSKTAVSLTNGSSTIVLPNTTSVVVGHKVQGTGVNATITALNATTKTITLSSPVTQGGSNVVLNFKVLRSSQTVSQTTNTGTVPSTISLNGISNGMVIKDLCAIGFDNPSPGTEAAALGLVAGASPGHQNFLIDGCKFVANGDAAVMSGSNPYLSNGTFQNCVFDGKTFTGSEPADVPAFSTFAISGTIKSIGAGSTVLTLDSVKGIVTAGSMQIPAFWVGSGQVQSISGNDVVVNKVASGSVGQSFTGTISNVAYSVQNVARNLVYIGQNTSPCNTQNITFKNNSIIGQTGAVISATGGKTMFNAAVTIESVGGLVENNVINGIFGAGDPNPLMSNYAIRCRQTGIIVRNNINNVKNGRGNTGFFIPFGTSENNNTVSTGLAAVSQLPGQQPLVASDSSQVISISKVALHPTFSVQGNWKLMTYVYKHKTSSKRLTVSFSSFATGVEKKMKIRQGVVAGMEFELHKVIISDANHNLMVVKRAEIENPQDYDFTLA